MLSRNIPITVICDYFSFKRCWISAIIQRLFRLVPHSQATYCTLLRYSHYSLHSVNMFTILLLVDKLVDKLESSADETEEVMMSTKQATAAYFFESQQYDLASKYLQSLLESPSLDPTQRILLTSRLILATAHTDKAEAIRFGKSSP